MKVVKTPLPGVLIIEPEIFKDSRGFFAETFHLQRYQREAGIHDSFVQDNHSRSTRGVLRGIHAQQMAPQGKLVRVCRGEVYDVAVDINPRSSTFGQWHAVLLNDQNCRQFWIPPGYAHGFQVLSEIADFEYKCTEYYDPRDEVGVVWNDPDIGIPWPIGDPIVSDKDAALPSLATLQD